MNREAVRHLVWTIALRSAHLSTHEDLRATPDHPAAHVILIFGISHQDNDTHVVHDICQRYERMPVVHIRRGHGRREMLLFVVDRIAQHSDPVLRRQQTRA